MASGFGQGVVLLAVGLERFASRGRRRQRLALPHSAGTEEATRVQLQAYRIAVPPPAGPPGGAGPAGGGGGTAIRRQAALGTALTIRRTYMGCRA